mmetsp:Transcript_23855/g.39823  ORF Transcript_23855/g.39823 Transcript_23855/m.39823 type:complete len:430 (+) Transcript_23855:73-1362(+)
MMMMITKMRICPSVQARRWASTTTSNIDWITTKTANIDTPGAVFEVKHPHTLPVPHGPEHYVPKAERGKKGAFNVVFKFGEETLMRNDRSCPTRELNFTPDHWKSHKSPYRKIKHVINTIRSSPMQRLMFPDLFTTASIAAGLTYYNEFISGAGEAITVDMNGFAGATTAIGLLAGFRLNASYGRYEECRIFWGETINTTRDLAGNTMMWMKDENQKKRMLKLIKAYPVCYKFHVNRKGCHYNMHKNEAGKPPFNDRVTAEFQAEVADIYTDGLHMEDLVRLAKVKHSGGNVGLEALVMMRETIAGSVGTVDSIYVREMDEQMQRLTGAMGASERVLRTPLPTSFTRHASRLMWLWTCLLPFAIYPAMGPYGTLPCAVATAYALLGIEDVGVQLEEPFDVLPLRQYSDVIFDSVNQIAKTFSNYKIRSK